MTQPPEHLLTYNRNVEEVLRRDFSKRQLKILELINFMSWWLGRPSAVIPPEKWILCGLLPNHLKSEIQHLQDMRVLIVSEGTNTYQIEPDYTLWQTTPVKKWSASEFRALILTNQQAPSVNLKLHSVQHGESSSPTNQSSSNSDVTNTDPSRFFGRGGGATS